MGTDVNKPNISEEKYQSKRLAFLYTFLRGNLISYRSIPKEVIPFATLSTNLQKDDIKLSQAMAIMRHYGYTLLIYIEPQDPDLATYYRGKCAFTNIAKTNPSESYRLACLKDFIEIEHLNLWEITDRLGLVPSNCYYWLKIDDILISKIFKIAHAFGRNLRFEMYKVDKTVQNEQSGLGSRIIMQLDKFNPISEEMLTTIWEKERESAENSKAK